MRSILVVAAALVAAACSKTEAPPLPTADAAGGPRPHGLGDPANSPRIVSAVKEVRAKCAVAGAHYVADCDAMRAYRALKVTKADATTLVALFEDFDEPIVALGAFHAARHPQFFREDPELARRLVVQGVGLLPEHDEIGPELAGLICRIDREKTQLGDRIVKLTKTARSDDLRAGLVSCLVRENPNDAVLRALAEEATRDPSDLVRRGAAWGLTQKPPTIEQCRGWAKDVASQQMAEAEPAAERLLSGWVQYSNPFIRGFPDGNEHNWCPPDTIDAALAAYQARLKGGYSGRWFWFLGDFGLAQNVTREQKAKAFGFAKAVNDRLPDGFDGLALEAMARLDPDAARPIIAAFGADGGDARIQGLKARAMQVLEERVGLE